MQKLFPPNSHLCLTKTMYSWYKRILIYVDRSECVVYICIFVYTRFKFIVINLFALICWLSLWIVGLSCSYSHFPAISARYQSTGAAGGQAASNGGRWLGVACGVYLITHTPGVSAACRRGPKKDANATATAAADSRVFPHCLRHFRRPCGGCVRLCWQCPPVRILVHNCVD